jgi:hypothetical protein
MKESTSLKALSRRLHERFRTVHEEYEKHLAEGEGGRVCSTCAHYIGRMREIVSALKMTGTKLTVDEGTHEFPEK